MQWQSGHWCCSEALAGTPGELTEYFLGQALMSRVQDTAFGPPLFGHNHWASFVFCQTPLGELQKLRTRLCSECRCDQRSLSGRRFVLGQGSLLDWTHCEIHNVLKLTILHLPFCCFERVPALHVRNTFMKTGPVLKNALKGSELLVGEHFGPLVAAY